MLPQTLSVRSDLTSSLEPTAHYPKKSALVFYQSSIFRYAAVFHCILSSKHASRRYLKILQWSAMNSESAMERSLKKLLDAGEELDFDTLVQLSESPVEEPMDIHIPLPDMFLYDVLLKEVAV